MALRLLAAPAGEWRLDIDAWRKSRTIRTATVLHGIAAERLQDYLADEAAAELERNTDPTGQTSPPSAELVPAPRHPRTRRKTTHAQFAAAGLQMAHWDMTEYLWSLENLTDNLGPALTRSCRLLVTCTIAKGLQLYFWPTVLGSTLSALTVYHAGFTLAYWASLRLVSRCRRRVDEFRQLVRDKNVSENDVRAWSGFNFTETRDFRGCLY